MGRGSCKVQTSQIPTPCPSLLCKPPPPIVFLLCNKTSFITLLSLFSKFRNLTRSCVSSSPCQSVKFSRTDSLFHHFPMCNSLTLSTSRFTWSVCEDTVIFIPFMKFSFLCVRWPHKVISISYGTFCRIHQCHEKCIK